MLEAKDISLSYQDGRSRVSAIDCLSLSVEPGQFVGILGPSGSGKSTLLYALSGLRKIESGTIRFEGRDYAAMGEQERIGLRRTRFGFVFQQHFLINYLTALENVMAAATTHTPEAMRQARELLRGLGLEGKEDRFVHELSGGERQRVAIGRATINHPAVVFADEPTGLLDRATGLQAMEVLCTHRGQASLVAVTHNPQILRNAHLVIRLVDGRIVDCSRPSVSLSSGGAS